MYHKAGTIRPHTRPAGARIGGRWYVLSLILALALLAFGATTALAVNPPPQQLYFVTLPEDDLLQLFDDDDAAGGTFPDPVSPIRSITSISIGSTGTLVYWDQWEDGGYDADIANPGANTYASPGNLDGTQIWGDGVLANGCPPSITNAPNPCTLASDDLLQAGDVIVLDNDVIVDRDVRIVQRATLRRSSMTDATSSVPPSRWPSPARRSPSRPAPSWPAPTRCLTRDAGARATSRRWARTCSAGDDTRPSRTCAGSSWPASAARPSMWTRTATATSWTPTISTAWS